MTPETIATTFIAGFEGFRSAPYQDIAGVWTIGYGFTYTEAGQRVTADTPPITQEAAYARLEALVSKTAASVRTMVYGTVTDNQLAALTSFAFNLGTNALRNSTLLKVLNQGNPTEAATHFGEWVMAGGKYSAGLATRRAAERALFLMVDENAKNPPVDAQKSQISPDIPPSTTSQRNVDVAFPASDTTDALNAAELAKVQS